MVAVAHDEAVAVLVALVDERGDVCIDLGAQRFGQHPAGAFANNLVDQWHFAGDRLVVATGCGVRDYGEHGRTFPSQRANAGPDQNYTGFRSSREGAPVHVTPPRIIHRF